jgi:hypothetical protein
MADAMDVDGVDFGGDGAGDKKKKVRESIRPSKQVATSLLLAIGGARSLGLRFCLQVVGCGVVYCFWIPQFEKCTELITFCFADWFGTSC